VQIVDGPTEARKAVREQIQYGADFIKVYGTGGFRFTSKGQMVSAPTFTLSELEASADEAHHWGKESPATPMAIPDRAIAWTLAWIRSNRG
jgi:imidazolonepropionase-like amidohydrolase